MSNPLINIFGRFIGCKCSDAYGNLEVRSGLKILDFWQYCFFIFQSFVKKLCQVILDIFGKNIPTGIHGMTKFQNFETGPKVISEIQCWGLMWMPSVHS